MSMETSRASLPREARKDNEEKSPDSTMRVLSMLVFASGASPTPSTHTDLLLRHERQLHQTDVFNKAVAQRQEESVLSQRKSLSREQADEALMVDGAPLGGPRICDLDLLSQVTGRVAFEGSEAQGASVAREPPSQDVFISAPSAFDDSGPAMLSKAVSPNLHPTDPGDPMQDFQGFLESIGLTSGWDDEVFASVETASIALKNVESETRSQPCEPALLRINAGSNGGRSPAVEEVPSFSRFGSRLPSLQPDAEIAENRCQNVGNFPSYSPICSISRSDHYRFVEKLKPFSDLLPHGFAPPSRHGLSRFFAGYADGLNEHLPFIHMPTLSVARCRPELTLALAATGSHYRFEGRKSIAFFHAARIILLDSLRCGVHAPRNADSDGLLPRESPGVTGSTRGVRQQQSTGLTDCYGVHDMDDLMEVIQTCLLLTICATWETDSRLLQEMLALQGIFAALVRKHGLAEQAPNTYGITGTDDSQWVTWVRTERDRRTKLVAYCFLNLHCLMYNLPPLILNSELMLNMPCPPDLWRARTPSQWVMLSHTLHGPKTSFQEAFTRLFIDSPSSSSLDPNTPLGNHVLIHAIVQQIFFARQLCLGPVRTQATSLREEDLFVLDNALRRWKTGWKSTPESSVDPRNPAGPIAFTSTAMLGLAYIRLHVDLGPHRCLTSLDPHQIANALHNSPALVRTPGLVMALLHSIHALSIPIRLGIDFVARTQALYWSVQHSLSSLEYAFLLSKWLLVLPDRPSGQTLSKNEQKLFLWIKSMMDEAEMTVANSEGSDTTLAGDAGKIRQLSVAIVRVWARTFKGNTSWAIVDLIGLSLDAYADLLED